MSKQVNLKEFHQKDPHPGGNGKQVEIMSNDQVNQRINDLLGGKVESPNEFVGYLAERIREGNQEAQVLQQNIQQLTQRLALLQKRAIQLQGEQNRYVQDIMAWWDRKPNNKPEEATR